MFNVIDGLWDRENRKNLNENFDMITEEQERFRREYSHVIDDITKRFWDETKSKNKIKIKDTVQTLGDLPSSDEYNTLRVVTEKDAIYRFNGSAWVLYYEIDLNPFNELKATLENLLSEIESNVYTDFSIEDNSPVPPKSLPTGNSFKIIEKKSNGELVVIQEAFNNYLRYYLRKNIGGSGYGEDYELLRVHKVEPLNDVLLYKSPANPIDGTVTSVWNYTGGNSVERSAMDNRTFDTGKRYFNNGNDPLQAYEIAGNSSVSYSMKSTTSDDFNVAFYARGGYTSSENFEILINGELLNDFTIRNSPMQSVRRFSFKVPAKDNFTLTIKNKSTNKLYLSAINLYHLSEINGQEVDNYSAYGHSGKTPFIDNQGASEYAFKNLENNLQFGSYHGGEKIVYCKMEYIDEDSDLSSVSIKDFTEIPIGKMWCTKQFSIRQLTNLIERIDMYSQFSFNDIGTVKFDMSYNIKDGEVPVPLKDLWVGLTCTHSSFRNVTYPIILNLGNEFTGESHSFNATAGKAVQTTLDGLQEIHIRHSRFNNSFTEGVNPYSVYNLELYSKYYYSPIRNNKNSRVAPTTFQFSKELDFYTA